MLKHGEFDEISKVSFCFHDPPSEKLYILYYSTTFV